MYLTSQPNEHFDWQVLTKGQKVVDQIILTSNTYKRKDRVLEAMLWKQEILKDYGIKV